MGELILALGMVAIICGTIGLCVLVGFWMYNHNKIALKREEENGKVLIEREKNERVLAVEQMKLEKAQLANEKANLYVNRDIAQAQIEAGVLGKEEDTGLSGIFQQLLPVLAQNPELMGKLSAFLGRGTQSGGGAGTPENFLPSDLPGHNQ